MGLPRHQSHEEYRVSSGPSCDENSRRSNAERYVAKLMAPPEAQAFEDHFVTCPDCQSEVRFASALVAAVPREGMATPPASAARPLWIAAGIALAAGLATFMLLRVQPRREFLALGAVREPPAYQGIPVRSADARHDSLFDTAMESYLARRYGPAAAELRAALAAGADSVPAQFFLATSLLLDDKARDAADEFARVLSHGETPYRAEARYYRAKALLRLGRAGDAQAELGRLTPADGVAYDMGKALADSITHVRAR
jgi:hypothetical protein